MKKHRTSFRRYLPALAVALAMGAGMARAESAAASKAMSRPPSPAAAALAQAAFAAPQPYAQALQSRMDGVVRTSVEQRFGARDNAVGEAGFLCGLLPHPDTTGAAAAFGHDPDGRFVGAKLRLAF
jgi:hypothetical protein